MTASASILPYLPLALLYGALAWLAWGQLTRPATPHGSHAPHAFPAIPQVLLPLALVWHAVLLYQTVWHADAVNFNIANALSAVTWITALLLWIACLLQPLPGITALLLPVVALCALLPAWDNHPHWLRYLDQPWAALHIAVALIAFSLFIVAALQALLLMSMERRLHAGLSSALDTALPPLLTLERFLFRLIAVAFVLLTFTVASGAFFSEEVFHQPFKLTHKVVFSLLAWVVFAGLLFGRRRYGWRGRIALRWILSGSALLLIAYLGSKFVLEVILGR
jgi:ABC-type uncharacterized transport system permease subunit